MTSPTHRRNPWAVLVVFFVLVAVVAVVGSLATTAAPETYSRLVLPGWAPPASLFGPVWTLLYVLLAFAGWVYWRTDGETQGFAMYGVSLLFNLLWTALFFAGGSTRLAVVAIVLLDFTVLMTIGLFYRRSRLAAVLLLPYFFWIAYATALNVAIVALNEGLR
ncbi:TspO/MBR family protein [Amycolatopsis sp. FDAARGOS 1241]|uniref:TspO/MBR family protein n=1 Tax=Amycolatopsis sp. FDAARGOS 1241 TaxID=2778070 RepID=UPI0019526459|nr:TspO/MBR family protein [Amycolatopsis sp. FDAARGOS 1241]QRP45504.1 tryptophan-rich sensory protein [Amycolatopsis sp. FDAARGOS 1241]